ARPRDAGAFREELLETARRVGLAGVTAAFDLDANLGGDSRNGRRDNGDGLRGGDSQRDAAGAARAEAETPSGRLVIDLDSGRAAPGNGSRRASRSGDTTVLASSTAEQARATGAFAAAATTASELSPARPRAFTRFRVMLDRRGSLTKRAPVLLALAALLAVAAITASVLVIKHRANGAANAANAAVAASPSPSPEATPQASPTPDESANTNAAQGGKGRREARTARSRRPPKGNFVTRTFKKIFKNPF
ncbi:MAG: hypothetical protein LC746_12410, partial [Acidobacteria bacterium]|nr:hypothetical protein [Acidobacteriota bacterium]